MIPRLTRSWYNTMPTVLTTYAAVLFAARGMAEARERQKRTLRASQLEAQLQTARFAALRAQLQPHFLYNTLNAIAALVADVRPAQAVAAIEQLSELLHASLHDDGREEIRIEEEVMLVERYLALQRMRKTDHANAVFDTALARLPASERARLAIVRTPSSMGSTTARALEVRVDAVPTRAESRSPSRTMARASVRSRAQACHGVGLQPRAPAH
jgi:hypothetical protein